MVLNSIVAIKVVKKLLETGFYLNLSAFADFLASLNYSSGSGGNRKDIASDSSKGQKAVSFIGLQCVLVRCSGHHNPG